MRSKVGWGALYTLGLLFCVVPAAVAVIDRYGFWNTGQRVSATVIVLLCLCAMPFLKQLRNALNAWLANPSAWGVWLALTIVFWLFEAITDDMLVVCYIALPTSVVGALIMAWARKKLKDDE